jgi:hypothetical protein
MQIGSAIKLLYLMGALLFEVLPTRQDYQKLLHLNNLLFLKFLGASSIKKHLEI